MKNSNSVLPGMLIVAAMALGFTALVLAGDPETRTLEGEVVDLRCFAGRGARGNDHAACAARCIDSGAPAALVDGEGNTYVIVAVAKSYSAYAAQTVKLTGRVKDNLIIPQKLEVKEGETWREVTLKAGAPTTE